jgi:hypothetical protein
MTRDETTHDEMTREEITGDEIFHDEMTGDEITWSPINTNTTLNLHFVVPNILNE